ncbi:MAG: GSU2403 family nucleotidyltransferase fold protein [Pseudomonadota bacterium]
MDKNQFNLCKEVLIRLENKGVLKHVILIGSWCLPFYKEYLKSNKYNPSIRTRDMDFLISSPNKIKTKVDIPEMLKDLGFLVDIGGSKGVVRLQHPDLMIEFLVPEKGKGTDKPYPLPMLGVNAQTIRFLNLLTENTITIKINTVNLILPHPINWALQKLIIYQRRGSKDKAQKDFEAAIGLLKALITKGESENIINIFKSQPLRWQNKIRKGLEKSEESKVLKIFMEA